MNEPHPDDPITLEEACRIVFGGRIKPSTLRAEAARGHLEIGRVGRRDFVTLRSVREMWKKCLAAGRPPASTLIANANNGPSATADASSARAALNQTVVALKRSLPIISQKSTRPPPDQLR